MNESPDSRLSCRPNRRDWLMVLAIAAAVRGGVFLVWPGELRDDPDGYRAVAEHLVDTGVYGPNHFAELFPGDVGPTPTAYRPPLYPLVLAACTVAPISPVTAIGGIHFVLGVATVLVVWRLAYRLGLGNWSLLAALLVAFDPILLRQSVLVMTETLATFLAICALDVMARASERESDRMHAGRIAAGAAILALAALCRPAFLATLLGVWVVTLLMAGSRRRQCAYGLGIPALVIVIFSPWIVRNASRFGRFIPASTHGGYTFFLGNNESFYSYLRTAPSGSVWEGTTFLTDRHDAVVDELRRAAVESAKHVDFAAVEPAADRLYYEAATDAIRARPGMFLYASLVRLGRLWQVVPHQVDSDEPDVERLVRFSVGGWYAFVFVLTAAGTWTLRGQLLRPPWVWGVVLCLSFTFVHIFYWSNMRMRAPLMPFVALAAAAGAARLWRSCR